MINIPTEMNTGETLKEKWEVLVNALRLELQEYGALLNLLTEQQNFIINRETEKLDEVSGSIEQQLAANLSLKAEREGMVTEMAKESGIKGRQSVRELMPFFPEKAQGLLKALIDEIFSIVERTQRKARQNKMLATRLAKVTEEVLLELCPQLMRTKTYDRKGELNLKGNSSATCIQASA